MLKKLICISVILLSGCSTVPKEVVTTKWFNGYVMMNIPVEGDWMGQPVGIEPAQLGLRSDGVVVWQLNDGIPRMMYLEDQ